MRLIVTKVYNVWVKRRSHTIIFKETVAPVEEQPKDHVKCWCSLFKPITVLYRQFVILRYRVWTIRKFLNV
jgi:hypothetical protein